MSALRNGLGDRAPGCGEVAVGCVVEAVDSSAIALRNEVTLDLKREGGEWWPSCLWTYVSGSRAWIRIDAKVCPSVCGLRYRSPTR